MADEGSVLPERGSLTPLAMDWYKAPICGLLDVPTLHEYHLTPKGVVTIGRFKKSLCDTKSYVSANAGFRSLAPSDHMFEFSSRQ